MSLELGENPEGKKRVKGKASRIQSSRIESALVCVRRNAQHRDLKLPESTRFAPNTAVMVAVFTNGPASPMSQIYSHTKKAPQAMGHRVKHQP